MKLGYIRMPDPEQACAGQSALADQIELADNLGLELVYLPGVAPDFLCSSLRTQTQHLYIGLDASAFGHCSPRDLEASIRATNDELAGRLFLGIEMGCKIGSNQSRAQAQVFETMFSQAPRNDRGLNVSRYPMRSPCPEIIGLPNKGTPQEVTLAAACGYLPMTPSWLKTSDVARHWPAIVAGATSSLKRAHPDHWKLARSIVVHKERSVVQDYVFGSKSPVRNHYTKLAKRGLVNCDIDTHMKRVVIAGSPDQVTDQLLALQETVCDIGTLQVVDHHGSDTEIARDTMISLAEKIIPAVNSAKVSITKELERI
jgi:hypothetical protein